MTTAGNRHYRAVIDLVPDRLTLILFSEGSVVMAEVIGPPGHADVVAVMPAALALAHERCPSDRTLLVLDDEGLWQTGWGRLEHD